MSYATPKNGIIKKQMKIVSYTLADLHIYNEKKKDLCFFKEYIIKEINNPLSRTLQFRDERKITIGISKKDIMNDLKVKSAFYNCFAITLRLLYNNVFREIHVKIFNTGKMEIPGIVEDDLFLIVKKEILLLLQSYIVDTIYYLDNDNETILINTNFNCGYFLNRIAFYHILINTYHLECTYDPCTYPGIKIKYYFTNSIGCTPDQTGRVLQEDENVKLKHLNQDKKYTEISIMVFRTGSCLIVGNCTDCILYFVFEYIKKILEKEMIHIKLHNNIKIIKKKKLRVKKRNISLRHESLYCLS
jgi:TATA-box binding protein (TBP) (component of TFIID and TFIIIB)